MVDPVFSASLTSSYDENLPQILLLGVAHFPEWLCIFSNVVSILLVHIQDVALRR